MFEKQCKSTTEVVQDPSSGDTSANPSSDPSHSANKDSSAAMDRNRIGDRPGTAELGERSTKLGVKQKISEIDSDPEAAADGGPKISQEKRRKLQDS